MLRLSLLGSRCAAGLGPRPVAAWRQRPAGAAAATSVRGFAEVIFTANAESDAGTRTGRVRTFGMHHGNLDLKLEKHPKHGGKGGGTNPEELFACAYAACFNGALRLCADKNGIPIGETSVRSSVSLAVESQEMTAGVPMRLGLAVKLEAEVAGVDATTAQRLVEMAHEFCPFSRATRGNVAVEVVGLASTPNVEAAPEERHGRSLRVLIVGRRADVMQGMLSECRSMGLEAAGAVTNAQAEALLKEHRFDACTVGFRYGELQGQDATALTTLLDSKGVPYWSMPPGSKNVRNALQRLGFDAPRAEEYNVAV